MTDETTLRGADSALVALPLIWRYTVCIMNLMYFVIICLLVIAGFAAVFWYLRRMAVPKEEGQGMVLLQQQLQQLTQSVDSKLGESRLSRVFSPSELPSNFMGLKGRSAIQISGISYGLC